jgi:hypothetical protein
VKGERAASQAIASSGYGTIECISINVLTFLPVGVSGFAGFHVAHDPIETRILEPDGSVHGT